MNGQTDILESEHTLSRQIMVLIPGYAMTASGNFTMSSILLSVRLKDTDIE
jgi:hypothetical protein